MNILTRLHRLRVPILIAACVLWLAAFVLTHVPGEGLPDVSVGDTTLHTIGYFGLASCLLIALAAFGVKRWPRIGYTVAATLSYAVLDEYTQQFVNRHTDFRDLLSDLVGLYVAVLVWELLLSILSRRTSPKHQENPD